MIHHILEGTIQNKLNKGKAILLMGARQAGITPENIEEFLLG